ncbi:MAG TPA: IspD/TarI family cytidylyltransferase [Spirochaetales bacterium]|nr:IspD/TarI family cytidylyltransferase [Spirochaetales bacterium]
MPDHLAFAAVVVAAGSSSRFANGKKEYRILDGKPVLAHSLSLFLDMPGCMAVVAVVPPHGRSLAEQVLGDEFLARYADRLLLAEGGLQRADSVRNGLQALVPHQPPLVLVHDGARPWASRILVERVLTALGQQYANGVYPQSPLDALSVIPGIQPTDTIKRVDGSGMVVEHPARSMLRAVQTPQGFPFHALLSVACASPSASASASVTDDAEAWSAAGGRVLVVEGERSNTKITFVEDLA